jgi:hypothetical protein
MSESHQPRTGHWADIIAEVYAADTRPPLPRDLCAELSQNIASELAKAEANGVRGQGWTDYVNPLLDEWEKSSGVVGPRLHTVDETSGTVQMVQRSQADHPLRPFGGQ